MLGLFCSSVLLKEHDFVPFDEVIFYIFTAVGLTSLARLGRCRVGVVCPNCLPPALFVWVELERGGVRHLPPITRVVTLCLRLHLRLHLVRFHSYITVYTRNYPLHGLTAVFIAARLVSRSICSTCRERSGAPRSGGNARTHSTFLGESER